MSICPLVKTINSGRASSGIHALQNPFLGPGSQQQTAEYTALTAFRSVSLTARHCLDLMCNTDSLVDICPGSRILRRNAYYAVNWKHDGNEGHRCCKVIDLKKSIFSLRMICISKYNFRESQEGQTDTQWKSADTHNSHPSLVGLQITVSNHLLCGLNFTV